MKYDLIGGFGSLGSLLGDMLDSAPIKQEGKQISYDWYYKDMIERIERLNGMKEKLNKPKTRISKYDI